MNAEWRTSTVVAMCRRMLDTETYDVLPILADALEDSGCDDAALLAECRAEPASVVTARRLVNLVHSEETAAAVKWLDEFADGVPRSDEDESYFDYAGIIMVGQMAAELGGYMFNAVDAPEHFRGEGLRTFYRNWSIVTGLPSPLRTPMFDGKDDFQDICGHCGDGEDDEEMEFRCAC